MPHSNAHSRESIEWLFLNANSAEVVCPVYSSQGSLSNVAPPVEHWSQLAEPTRRANPPSTIILRRYPPQALPDIIAASRHLVIQRAAFAGLQVFVKLLGAGGAEDDGVHLGPAEQPLER